MSAYRSSTGHLDRFEEPPRGAAERWDREKFERIRRGGGPASSAGGRGRDDYDHFRLHEHERYPGGHRDLDIHEDRRRPGPPVLEREIFHDDRFERPPLPPRPHELFHEPTPTEIANQALTPYRRRSVTEKDISIAVNIGEQHRSARPQRPGYIRRQSSLDTFDRRPLPRYAELERHEYRSSSNAPIPLPIRERRRSPPRRFYEDEYDEVRSEDRSSRGRERESYREGYREGYREVEVHLEKSRVRRSKSVAKSTRSSSISSFEEIQPPRATWGKRGKTRLPKRLARKQAIIELGYPFEEEDDFIIITRALEKEHIDEVIRISENYQDEKVTYVYEESVHETPAPPPPASVAPLPPPPLEALPPPPASVVHAPPPPPVQYAPAPIVYAPPPASHYAPSQRAPSPSMHEHERYVEIERSNEIHGPATAFLPEGRQLVRREDHRSEREIRDEIRLLEEERRMLKYEREGDREYEFIERAPKKDIVRVDRDRKVRIKDRPNPKLVAAMMSTLM